MKMKMKGYPQGLLISAAVKKKTLVRVFKSTREITRVRTNNQEPQIIFATGSHTRAARYSGSGGSQIKHYL
jgi:hypothetical protein